MFVNQECLVTLTKVSFCPIAFYLDRSSLPIKIQTIRAKKNRRNDWRRKAKNLMNFETDFILGNEAFKIIQS
jgi:hypothetical protein